MGDIIAICTNLATSTREPFNLSRPARGTGGQCWQLTDCSKATQYVPNQLELEFKVDRRYSSYQIRCHLSFSRFYATSTPPLRTRSAAAAHRHSHQPNRSSHRTTTVTAISSSALPQFEAPKFLGHDDHNSISRCASASGKLERECSLVLAEKKRVRGQSVAIRAIEARAARATC